MGERALIFRRVGDDLRPVDEAALEAVRSVRAGDICRVDGLKRPRNLAKLQKYWALVHEVHANQSLYATPEALHEALKVALGVYSTVRMLNTGKLVVVPGSISFGSMAEHVFDRFLNDCIRLVVEHILPGVTEEALRQRLEEITGERRAA